MLRAVEFSLQPGETLCLLGVNGAGKSTLIKLLAGLLAPTHGQVRIRGTTWQEQPEAGRSQLGYVPEQAPLYPELRVEEYLRFVGSVRGLRAAALRQALDRVVERCELAPVRRRLCGLLSKGYAQRLNLAQALLHEPLVLLLDEPTSGLDPVHSMRFYGLLRELQGRHAVLISTHDLHEAAQLAGSFLILHQGQVSWRGHRHDLGPDATESLGRRFLQAVLQAKTGQAA